MVVVREGASPLVLSMPHVGTVLPPEVARHLNDRGRAIEDTDWHIDRLYAFADALDPSVVRAEISRYAIDVNRDPSGRSLYPGQATTDLVPTTTFDGAALYATPPDATEIARRREAYFVPYHQALEGVIARTIARHGWCLLWDCHSIRAEIPRLFPGRLPVLNIGTNEGRSCAPAVREAVAAACSGGPFTSVVDGRFKGGWITRHYGQPALRVHAVQMELTQIDYLVAEAPPWDFDAGKAKPLQAVLDRAIRAALAAAATFEGTR